MKWINFFRSTPVQLCLFLICGFLFVWPFLALPVVGRPKEMFLYLFSAWAVVLLLAFLISTACRHDPAPQQKHVSASNVAAAAGCKAPGMQTSCEKAFRSID